MGAATVAIAWSWSPRSAWNLGDIRTLEWTLAFEKFMPILALVLLLPLVLLALAIVIAFVRRRENGGYEAPWRVASWTAMSLTVPLIVFTIGVFAADVAKTESWTLARQNLGALRGDAGCGLADDLVVPAPGSARPLAIASGSATEPEPSWARPAPAAGLRLFGLGPAGTRPTHSPWFELPAAQEIGVFVAGVPGATDTLALEWGRFRSGRVEALASNQISKHFSTEAMAILPWRFVTAGELPSPSPGASLVRMTLHSDVPPGPAIAISAPVTYANETLAARLERTAAPSLVHPRLLTYFPCVELPR